MGNAKEKDVQGWSKMIVLDIVIVKSRQVDTAVHKLMS
jgi:hypothetical protein